MHALLVRVNIAEWQFERARTDLRKNVAPQRNRTPGFIKGYWMVTPDGRNGVSVVVFSTQSEAENAATMPRNSPMATGVTITGVEILEVLAEE